MRAGDLIGFESQGIFAFLIRLGQRLRRCRNWHITHIGIIVDNSGDLDQAVRTVDRVKLASYKSTPHVVIPFPGPDDRRADVVAFANSKLGQKYGVLSVISRGLNCITPKFIQINANRAGRMDCSTLGARAWEHGGILIPWPDPYQVMPAQLCDAYEDAS